MFENNQMKPVKGMSGNNRMKPTERMFENSQMKPAEEISENNTMKPAEGKFARFLQFQARLLLFRSPFKLVTDQSTPSVLTSQ